MKVIKSANSLTIPEGIELTVRNRVVTVTGVRGSLTKKFNHAPVDLKKDGNTVRSFYCYLLRHTRHKRSHNSTAQHTTTQQLHNNNSTTNTDRGRDVVRQHA